MNWQNLNNYQCPKCKSDLKAKESLHTCTKCDFGISEDKLKKIISDMKSPKKRRCGTFEQIEKTQEELSNL